MNRYRDPEHHIGRRLGTPGYGESNFDKLVESLPTIKDYKNKVEKILQFGPVNGEKLKELNRCYWNIDFQEGVEEFIDQESNEKFSEQKFNLAQAEENNLTSSRMSKMSRR